MITDPPLTAHILEHLLFFIATYVPVISCSSSRSQIPLRITMLHFPSPIVVGESTRLRCAYHLADETLYAVKWYKDMGEFYRYVPAANPTLKTFPQSGIDVDMSKSDNTTVFLQNLSIESSGNYTCQVSTDKPYFRCVQMTRQLEVVVPPSDGPMLAEEKSYYELGDNVSILCNSGRSKPAPELKWYINDRLAHSELSDQETVVYPDQLESTSLSLRFRLKPEVLHNGKVILKCVASISHIQAVTIKEITAKGSKQVDSQRGLILFNVSICLLLYSMMLKYHMKEQIF